MKIEFAKIEEKALPEFLGGKKEFNAKMYTDSLNKILEGRLVPGASIGLHTHETSSEIMFFTKGSGTVIYDGTPIGVAAGDVHYCPKGHSHTLINDGSEDLLFHAVVPQQ